MPVGLQERSGSGWWAAGAFWECLVGFRGILGVLVGLQEHPGNACWAAGALWECLVG